jgi:N-acyl-D-amino-acid deacylase
MAHDLVIKGGSVIDGTGADARHTDIAMDGGRISRIGDLTDAEAATEIDASGKIVTPGFVDVHTHLDAQVGWDPEMRSSSYHGVTTALIGNCGVTFAPVSPENRRYLAELMEAVEDIPADDIMDGLPWTWTSYGEYLDAVQGLDPALNIVGLAGHSSIRFEAMGDRGLDEGVQATDQELGRIADLVRESVAEGAVGFSTSRFLGHTVPDGRCTPGTWADLRETETIQQAIIEGGGAGGLFQAAPDFSTRFRTELEMFEKGAELGCQVMFSGGARPKGDGDVSFWQDFLGRNNAEGRRITTIAHTRPSGSLFGLAQMCPFRSPAWKELMGLPTIADRYERLSDPVARNVLITEAKEVGFLWNSAPKLHPLGTGEFPDYDLEGKASLTQLADASGKDPVDVFVDHMLESEGRELFNMWMFGGHLENQWAYLKMEQCIPLLGDAGAHVGQLMDADSTTFLLSELTRERGVFTLPDAVRQLTSQPADLMGLRQRGQIREGWHGDLNVIDYEALTTCHPEYVNDLPHGGGRFIAKSHGYDATIVGGRVVVKDGQHTGNRPGEVIRDFKRD